MNRSKAFLFGQQPVDEVMDDGFRKDLLQCHDE
jgi:hypothetical protein